MMKIVAGLGSVEDYPVYVQAGADEIFCGYVPTRWNEKYGTSFPLNRREVRYYNVQIGAREDLKILKQMMDCYGVPVTIAMNSLLYTSWQYPEIQKIMEDCMKIGFTSFIIADPALLYYLKTQGIECNIHISGEMSEYNVPFIQQLAEYRPKRVIFHRKCSIEGMKACVQAGENLPKWSISEYEAFILNEMCYFTGAYCNSLHCDELCHICHVPYRFGTIEEGKLSPEIVAVPEYTGELVGESGCGLCALWKLQSAGVTHLKIVGRGNDPEEMERDIRAVKRALDILEASSSEEDYLQNMKSVIFPKGCSNQCYYLFQ